MKKVIYPGTFDPVTFGHIDIIKRAAELFDSVQVTVAINPSKKPLFTVEERVDLLKKSLKGFNKVSVDSFDGLVVDHAHKVGATGIIRGLRAVSDFEYEFQMATMNRRLDADIETAFVMAREDYTFVSSRFIREISSMGGDVSTLVPSPVLKHLQKAFNQS